MYQLCIIGCVLKSVKLQRQRLWRWSSDLRPLTYIITSWPQRQNTITTSYSVVLTSGSLDAMFSLPTPHHGYYSGYCFAMGRYTCRSVRPSVVRPSKCRFTLTKMWKFRRPVCVEVFLFYDLINRQTDRQTDRQTEVGDSDVHEWTQTQQQINSINGLRLDSNLTTALYKSFTYLLTYLLT